MNLHRGENLVQNEIINDLVARRPDLAECVGGLWDLHDALAECYAVGGTLFICGNGGSNADAIHIVGELCKSFERKRPLPEWLVERLHEQPMGHELAAHLETGLRAHALGSNGSLKTAIENDCALRDIAFAQELNALAREGDMLLAISTSGNAKNCLMAMSVAKAHECIVAVLTGPHGGLMAEYGDIVLKAPGGSVKTIQESHMALWHTMCCLIEAHYFPEMRS